MTIKDITTELRKLERVTDIYYDVLTDDINGNKAIMVVHDDKRCILEASEIKNTKVLYNNLRFYLGIS